VKYAVTTCHAVLLGIRPVWLLQAPTLSQTTRAVLLTVLCGGCCCSQAQKEKRDDLLAEIELLRQQYEAAAAASGRLSSAGPERAPGQLTFANV
jgi:hypothetical protein